MQVLRRHRRHPHLLALSRPQADIGWRDLASARVISAPAGGARRRYFRHHLLLLRLWRRLCAWSVLRWLGGVLLPAWRLTPAHVEAEARAVHAFAGDGGPAARQAIATLIRAAPAQAVAAAPNRVIMLAPSLAAGGAERQLVLTARGLAERGWAVEVAAKHLSDPPGHDHLAPALADLPLALIPGSSESAGLGEALMALPPGFRDLVARLRRHCLERRPMVVHAWMDEMAAAGGLAAALAGVPRIILAGRNLAPHRFGAPQLPAIRNALALLAARPEVSLINNSAAGAEDYARWLGLAPEGIQALRNGFAPMADGDGRIWRRRLGIPAQAAVVGGLFRLAAEKRPHLWLRTAQILAKRNPAAHFIIFGDGPLRTEVQSLSRRLGLSDRLHLPGVVEDRANALAALDVFLLTSDLEGLPNVALECQWMGVPLVATRAGGLAEALRRPDELQPTDAAPSRLAQAVERRIGGPVRPERGWVEAQFGLGRMLDETEALYRRSGAP